MKYSVKIAPERRKNKEGNIIAQKVPIYADIRFSGKRVFYFTGYRIDNDKFDFEKEDVKKNASGWEGRNKVQYNIINKRFRAIKATLELFFSNIDSATKNEVIAKLDRACNKATQKNSTVDELEFFSLWERYIKEARVEDSTRKQFKTTLNHWKRFDQQRKTAISFETVNGICLREFEQFLKNDKIPKGRNSINSRMKITRTFWNYAKKIFKTAGKSLSDPFGEDGYKMLGEIYGTPIYITKEEVEMLFTFSIEDEKLKRVRDIFIFQCMIGTRISDLVKLTKKNVNAGKLTLIANKTKKDKPKTLIIPLNDKALEIISRYDLPDGRLLPFISDQKYGLYIKELFVLVELTRMVSKLNSVTGVPEQVKLSDLASSHMARRTFIGNMYGKVDKGIISSMTGHSENSRSFSRYHTVTPELKKNAVDLL